MTPWKTLWSWSVAPYSYNRAIEFETNEKELYVTAKGLKWKIVEFSVMSVDRARMLASDVKRRIGDKKRMTGWDQNFKFQNYETAPPIGHVVIQTQMIKNVTVEQNMGNKVVRKVARQIVKPVMRLNLRVPVDLLENAINTGQYKRFVSIPDRYTFEGEQQLRF